MSLIAPRDDSTGKRVCSSHQAASPAAQPPHTAVTHLQHTLSAAATRDTVSKTLPASLSRSQRLLGAWDSCSGYCQPPAEMVSIGRTAKR